MKKLIFMLVGLFALIASSCTNEASLQGDEPQAPEKSAIRTEAEAIQIAQDLANTRHGSRAATSVANVEIIGSKSRSAATDTLIYVINYADEAGYAMVSAAKSGEQIIGFSDNGTYIPEEAEENPNFSYFLNMAKNYVAENINNGLTIGPLDPIPNPDKPITTISLAGCPIAVQWGQDYPEGKYCPNGVSGCVQTALAQIMTRLEKPTSIALTYDDRDQDVQVLNWSEIKQHSKSDEPAKPGEMRVIHSLRCNATEESHNAIGRLCRQLGELNNAVYYYYPEATGATTTNALKTMWNLYRSSNVYVGNLMSFSNTRTLYELMRENNDGVAYVDGAGVQGGHAWVCDAAEEHTKTYNLTKADGSIETITESNIYYHYNWGWCGVCDGYYSAGVFKVNRYGEEINFDWGSNFFFVYEI